jgi:hypothetical protein
MPRQRPKCRCRVASKSSKLDKTEWSWLCTLRGHESNLLLLGAPLRRTMLRCIGLCHVSTHGFVCSAEPHSAENRSRPAFHAARKPAPDRKQQLLPVPGGRTEESRAAYAGAQPFRVICRPVRSEPTRLPPFQASLSCRTTISSPTDISRTWVWDHQRAAVSDRNVVTGLGSLDVWTFYAAWNN